MPLSSRPRAKLCRLRRGQMGNAVFQSWRPVTPARSERARGARFKNTRSRARRPRPRVLARARAPPARAWPAVVGRRAEHAEDLVQLVDLALAREHRALGDHLDEDRADRPDVDGRRVRLRAEQDLGRPVPQRDDIVRERADRRAERAREPEVGELEPAVLRHEQVLRLEVAVHHAARVAEREAAQDLQRVRLRAA